MKTVLLFLYSFFLFCVPLFAQPTQAELDKKIKDAKEEIERMKKDPKYKDLMKDMPDLDSMMKISKGTNPTTSKTKVTDSLTTVIKSPNTKLLNALPVRTFNRAELISYLRNLNVKLTEILGTNYSINIKGLSENAIRRSGSSIAYWVNDEAGRAVLTAVKAAELRPDNITLLNNAGGILTSCGLAMNAIPVLEYALEKKPDNNLIQNNLGQAYLDLGDDKKAEQYLLRAVKSYEYYPDANLGLALIKQKNGNLAAAIKYAENSLRGGWSAKAENFLRKLKPDARLMDYVRHRYKTPDFFNYHKYPLPRQVRNVEEAIILKSQHMAYQTMLTELADRYNRLKKTETELYKKSATEKMTKAIATQRSPYRPFGIFANAVVADLNIEYADKFIRLDKYRTNFLSQLKSLEANYKADIKNILDCGEKNTITNTYLPKFADLREAYQAETINLYKVYLNDWYFWSYIASVDEHGGKIAFYNMASTFINTLKEISVSTFLYPCIEYKENNEKAQELVIEDPECFIPKVVLPFGPVNLEISCETFKLEAGAGFVGKFEYDRKSGEVTIAFGIGGAVPNVFFDKWGIELGLEADAKSQFYITFDKTGPTDLGVLWETELKVVLGLDEVKVEVGLGEEALTAGFGTGVQMKEGGPLKALIDNTWYVQPDDKQQNKNVPLYKK